METLTSQLVDLQGKGKMGLDLPSFLQVGQRWQLALTELINKNKL